MTVVFHVITTIERGGAEASVLELAKQQVTSGHEVHVVPLKGKLELFTPFADNGVTVNLDYHNLSFLYQWIKIRKLKSRYEGVLFHAHLPRSELLLSLAGKGINFIITRHNSESFLPSRFSKFSPLASRFVSRRARAVIAISHATEFFLRSKSEVDSRQTIEVVHYGYTPRFKSPHPIVIPQVEDSLTTNILTIGRLVKQKNLLFALNVMFALKKDEHNFHFTIIGDGLQRADLEKRTAELGLQERVTFAGRTRDVFKHMSKAHLFLMTSLYEGFGLVNLEAMDYGLPVVAPFASTFPEILGVNHPLLFEQNSVASCTKKIRTLLNYSSTEIQTLQESQRSFMEKFSDERYLLRHNDIYKQVFDNDR